MDNFWSRVRSLEQRVVEARQLSSEDRDNLLRDAGLSLTDLIGAIGDRSGPLDLRRGLCWVLARLGDRRRVGPALIRLARDSSEDSGLRAEAARCLGYVRSKRATRPLIDVLLSDPVDEVRTSAAYALGPLRDSRSLSAMISVLNNRTESPDLRGMVAEQLSWFEHPRVVCELIRALGDEVAEVRFWAAYSLGRIGDHRSVAALQEVAATDHAVRPPYGSIAEEAQQALQSIRARVTTVISDEEVGRAPRQK